MGICPHPRLRQIICSDEMKKPQHSPDWAVRTPFDGKIGDTAQDAARQNTTDCRVETYTARGRRRASRGDGGRRVRLSGDCTSPAWSAGPGRTFPRGRTSATRADRGLDLDPRPDRQSGRPAPSRRGAVEPRRRRGGLPRRGVRLPRPDRRPRLATRPRRPCHARRLDHDGRWPRGRRRVRRGRRASDLARATRHGADAARPPCRRGRRAVRARIGRRGRAAAARATNPSSTSRITTPSRCSPSIARDA